MYRYLFAGLHPLDLELVVGGIVFILEVSLDLVDGPADVVAVETDVVGLEDSGLATLQSPRPTPSSGE